MLIEEILRRKPETRGNLSEYLSRLGWTFSHGIISAVQVFDPDDLLELPRESHKDLRKAAQRFRDGDLSGAISAASGAVDAATGAVYQQEKLGNPAQASFQERCKRASAAKGVMPKLAQQLQSLGWQEAEVDRFKKNFEGALNQGAYVMQTLRSKMGDVHGSRPILRPLVFDCLKWAEIVVNSLVDQNDEP